VNLQNQYELRVFVVNFDTSTISVFNPDPSRSNLALVDTIYVGPGPFAMAFDPFSLEDVANNAVDKIDSRQTAPLKMYRFAYVASFTQSFVQVIDLDESQPTFESVVFTLGKPTPPKGT
jgi:DNA-binding beta-propeller fold protein YncE